MTGELFDMPAESTPIENAVNAQIAWLEEQGVLDQSHGIVVATIRELADVIGKSAGRGRGSSVALASKELREYLALLPQPAGEGDPWQKLEADMQKASEDAAAAAKARAAGRQ